MVHRLPNPPPFRGGSCFAFFGRLSPSQMPMGEPDNRWRSSESPPRRAGSPWVSRRLAKGPVDAWPGEWADHGGSAPVFQAQQESVAQEGKRRSFERRRESGSEESALREPSNKTSSSRGNPTPDVQSAGRRVRGRWLWELWPKPKFLVCRDETRLIYIAGRRRRLGTTVTSPRWRAWPPTRRRRPGGASPLATGRWFHREPAP